MEAPTGERRRCEDRGAEGAERGRLWEGISPSPANYRGLGQRRELPQRGPRQSTGRKRFLKHILGSQNGSGTGKKCDTGRVARRPAL